MRHIENLDTKVNISLGILIILLVPAYFFIKTPNTTTKRLKVSHREILKLNRILVPVCSCESTGSVKRPPKQFNSDGSVIRGKINKNDIGECQINIEKKYGHLQMAKKLGFDIYTKNGNIAYANWLFKKYGTSPWKWSRPCWSSAVNQMTTK